MIVVGKSQLVKKASDKSGVSQKVAGEIVDAVLEEVLATIRMGGEVKLPGYMTIGSKHRSARDGRNPRTGESIRIEAKTVPSLRAGKLLKDAAEESNHG